MLLPDAGDRELRASVVACGRLEEARAAAERLLAIDPDYSCAAFAQVMPYRSDEDLASVTGPLQQAGIPRRSSLRSTSQ